jgi:two-component system CheB/CheR fusion protein
MTPDAARVLVVDDDPALLVALPEALRLRMPHVTVETVGSASEALERVSATEFDALISDIKMPGIDGLNLLMELRRIRPDMPTLLITGHGQHDLAVQALRGGAFDFIQKPVDRDYLVASLSRAITVHQLQRRVDDQQRALEHHAADLERAVEERTSELRAANEAKDEFLAMLAHELRNPLASIRSAVDLMSVTGRGDSACEEALHTVDRHVRHMTRQLDDLLDVSRITRRRIVLRRAPLDLCRLIREVVDGIGAASAAADLRLAVDLPAHSLFVNGDQTRLEQVLINLLNNSLKYTDPGGWIHVSGGIDGDDVFARVEDNGIGIAPEMLPRVFDLFSQADRSLDRSRGGLGIGLTLVRVLVELHGGSVEAASPGEGRGSTFMLRLPRQSDTSLTEEVEDSRQHLVEPRRILLVDDNPTVIRMMKLLLQHCGHVVVAVASDGLSAIDAAREHMPDVVLLDIGLPRLDGYEVARRIRRQPGLEHVLLVAMTGYGQEEDRRRSRAAGIDQHVVKPVSIGTLQEVLARGNVAASPCAAASG